MARLPELTLSRVAGYGALVVASMIMPLTGLERWAVMAAAAIGFGLSLILVTRRRFAVSLVGPVLLVLALSSQLERSPLVTSIVTGTALLIGMAAADDRGLSHAAAGIGLATVTYQYRLGAGASDYLYAVWLALVLVNVIFDRPPDDTRETSWPRTRMISAAWMLAIAVPLAATAAVWIDIAGIGLDTPQPSSGHQGGPEFEPHPGLAGGLSVGEPVHLSDDEVLRVRSEIPQFWRGVTYDQWDGVNWTSTVRSEVATWDSAGLDIEATMRLFPIGSSPRNGQDAQTDHEESQGPASRYEFEAQVSGIDVLFAPWRPVGLWATVDSAELGQDASIVLSSQLDAGASWTVESVIGATTPDDLRAADPIADGAPPLPPEIAELAIETDIDPEVARLAVAIAAEDQTTYDKIIALEDWMADNIVYTRDIERLTPGQDAVTDLLFHSRRGFCEQIGSALVVMARSLGIPARLAVGYVPGEFDAGRNQWVSRGTDAHAWAEVWFPGIGWHGFDPTAGVRAEDGSRQPVAVIGLTSGSEHSVGWLSLTATAGLLGALVIGRSIVADRRRLNRPTPSVTQLNCTRFNELGAQLGLEWSEAMTFRERAVEMVRCGVDPTAVARTVEALERSEFGGPAHSDQAELADGHQ